MRKGCRKGWRPTAVAPTVALACLASLPPAKAQRKGPELSEQEIVRRFTEAESRLREARNNYTFKQDVLIQTLTGDTVNGTFRRVSEILFDDNSKRIEKITY